MENLANLSDEEILSKDSPESVEVPTEEVEVPETITETNTEEKSESNLSTEESIKETSESLEEKSEEEVIEDLPEDFDYKSEYLKLRKPFKAGGKTVTVKTAEEMISLMQQGIGYTSKSQKLKKQVKLANMLESAGLSKEDLTLFIDVSKKNPKALQKLIKDSNIDPLDLDMSDDAEEYVPSNYEVSDEELRFKGVIEELSESDSGKTLIQDVRSWDARSKDIIWKEPNLLTVLSEQVNSGVYKVITDEMSRQRLVGTLDPDIPFLQAYDTVGQQLLQKKAKSSEGNVAKVEGNTSQKVVDRKANIPKPMISNQAKAKAASSTSIKTKPVNEKNSLMEMSDDEFLKLQMPM